MIRAGLEYGAEIWGGGQWEEAELIQREVGRRILGCSRMTSNAAVRGELGWWKLSTRREFLMLKYWIGLLLMNEERLVKAVYKQSKRVYISEEGKLGEEDSCFGMQVWVRGFVG